MSYAEVDKIAKMIPFDLKMTLDKALAESPPLQDAYQKDPKVKELIDISRRLEGTTRHASTHAAGVVISPVPLTDLVPLASFKGGSEGVTTQYDMHVVLEGVASAEAVDTSMRLGYGMPLGPLALADRMCRRRAVGSGSRSWIDRRQASVLSFTFASCWIIASASAFSRSAGVMLASFSIR